MDKFRGLFPVLQIHETLLNEQIRQGLKELQQSADGRFKGHKKQIFPDLMEKTSGSGGIAASPLNPFKDEKSQNTEGTVGHSGVNAAALIFLYKAEKCFMM